MVADNPMAVETSGLWCCGRTCPALRRIVASRGCGPGCPRRSSRRRSRGRVGAPGDGRKPRCGPVPGHRTRKRRSRHSRRGDQTHAPHRQGAEVGNRGPCAGETCRAAIHQTTPRSPCPRTPSSEILKDSRALAATPSPSWIRPKRTCSVPDATSPRVLVEVCSPREGRILFRRFRAYIQSRSAVREVPSGMTPIPEHRALGEDRRCPRTVSIIPAGFPPRPATTRPGRERRSSWRVASARLCEVRCWHDAEISVRLRPGGDRRPGLLQVPRPSKGPTRRGPWPLRREGLRPARPCRGRRVDGG